MTVGSRGSRDAELESALAVIRRAIHNEIAGQRFYSDAAFYCIDPWAKEIFCHAGPGGREAYPTPAGRVRSPGDARPLDRSRRALASASEVDITRFTFPDDEPAEELFPPQWSCRRCRRPSRDDLAALAFGIDMEQEAIELYARERASIQDPAAQEAYEFLVEEETRHYPPAEGPVGKTGREALF